MSVYGIIDIGSHAVRLGIYENNSGGNITQLENLSYGVPLGRDVFISNKISFKNIRYTCSVLSDYFNLMKEYDVKDYKAVATSAVREALNCEIFIDRINSEVGLKVEILEPEEEVKLTYTSLITHLHSRFNFKKHNILLCNIGTGTTQFYFAAKDELISMQSIRFGTLRLRELLENAHITLSAARKAISEMIADYINTVVSKSKKIIPDLFIVTGGNTRSLLKVAYKSRKVVNFASINKNKLKNLKNKISNTPPDTFAEEYGISDDYAYGLEPCCLFVEGLMKKIGSEKVIIASVDTRISILENFINEAENKPDDFMKHLLSAAKFIGEKYNYDKIHSENVRKYSEIIFNKLQKLHNMGAKEKSYLILAAVLHDIGTFIDTRKHHKHSYYLINNSMIPGISFEEINLIALTARYHRKVTPKNSHIEFYNLNSNNKTVVTDLASILRVADALDRSHDGRIDIKDIDITPKEIKLKISSDKDIILEKMSLDKKKDLFEEVFCRKLVIVN